LVKRAAWTPEGPFRVPFLSRVPCFACLIP
jgi:hypothetical protein